MQKNEIVEKLLENFTAQTPRPVQVQAFEHLSGWIERLLIQGFASPLYFGCDASTGCHGKGTPILMYDGTVKLVQDVTVGDLLMGPDSAPRKVLRLYRGRQKLYEVIPTQGERFVVNQDHVLSLQKTLTRSNHRTSLQSKQGRKRRKDFKGLHPIKNLTVKEYLEATKSFKHVYKLYRVPVKFPQTRSTPFKIPPYILGLWLGDGSSSRPELTTIDATLQEEWVRFATSMGCQTRVRDKKGTKAVGLYSVTKKGEDNPILQELQALNLINNKHIPQSYKTGTTEERLELLAGLMDSDGHLGSNIFDFISVKEELTRDVAFVARSLGFAASISEEQKGCQTGAIGTYWRLCISGNCERIPTRLERKKATPRLQIKDVSRSGFILKEKPEGDYFGFEVDGDHLYLLGDFTVTHNSGKSHIAITTALTVQKLAEEAFPEWADADPDTGKEPPYPYQIWVITQNKLLQDQYGRDFSDTVFDFRGLDNYRCYHDPGATCGQSKCGRVNAPKEKAFKPPEFCAKNCEYDEVKRKAVNAPILLLNAAKALNLLKGYFPNKPMMIIYDEAHGIEAALDSEASFEIKPETLDRVDISFNKYFQYLGDMQQMMEKLGELKIEAARKLENEMEAPASLRDAQRIRKLEALVNKVGEITEFSQMGVEFVNCSAEHVDLRPLQIHGIFRKFFEYPMLFLSATLLSKKGFMAITGLKDQEFDWFSAPSTFPKENRPIYYFWRMGAQSLNFKNMDQQFPNVVRRAASILDKHADEKGIIHTHTYRNAQRIYQELFPKYGDRLLFPKNAKEQKEILNIHAKSKNTVLISPSMTEGVDLKDDQCRFSILLKVPFLPTQDPVVKSRMDSIAGWYEYKTAMTVVQAPGRGVRSAEDYAHTYLLDPMFATYLNRASEMFPPWFMESVKKLPMGPV